MSVDLPIACTPAGAAAALKRWRRVRGMKQSHVAELTGVTQTTVSRWESGTHLPSDAEARKLAAMMCAPLDPRGDWVLRRLVESSADQVHLVCDTTHRLLAASRPRAATWRCPASDLMGVALWQFATPGIRDAEGRLLEIGWFEPAAPPVAVWTDANDDPVVPIRRTVMLWDRIQLSDGSFARLATDAGTVPVLPSGVVRANPPTD